MIDQITTQLALSVFRKAELLADYYSQPVTPILAKALKIAQEEADVEKDAPAELDQALSDFLMQASKAQFVAVLDGKLIDYDFDEAVLVKRISSQFPAKAVLIIQVRPVSDESE